jgi:hypothetical protein
MKRFLILLFTIFVTANLNAMQSFKRILPVLLKSNARFTSRRCQYLSHLSQNNGLKAVQLSQLAPRLNYCPIRSFSPKQDKLEAHQVGVESTDQSLKEQQKVVLEKVIITLESDGFKEFLGSDGFERLLESEKFKELFENPNFINKMTLSLLKNKSAMEKLLNNETFIDLMYSSEMNHFFKENPKAVKAARLHRLSFGIGCVLAPVAAFYAVAFLLCTAFGF